MSKRENNTHKTLIAFVRSKTGISICTNEGIIPNPGHRKPQDKTPTHANIGNEDLTCTTEAI